VSISDLTVTQIKVKTAKVKHVNYTIGLYSYVCSYKPNWQCPYISITAHIFIMYVAKIYRLMNILLIMQYALHDIMNTIVVHNRDRPKIL